MLATYIPHLLIPGPLRDGLSKGGSLLPIPLNNNTTPCPCHPGITLGTLSDRIHVRRECMNSGAYLLLTKQARDADDSMGKRWRFRGSGRRSEERREVVQWATWHMGAR